MEDRRRKLNFRAWRRGFKEMDLLMGQFADAYLEGMNDAEMDEFEQLLAIPDWEVYAWLVGSEPVPAESAGPVLDRLLSFKYDPRP